MEKKDLLKKEDFQIFLDKNIKKILFIGGSDTGKTTLLKDIANFLFEKGKDVFIFDCDIGQSHVGPPTTVGYAKLKEKIEDFYLNPEKFYFVGAVTPASSIVEFLTGIFKIYRYLEDKNGKVLIDTTGYIRDRNAISLKIHKIEILKPDFVILLERDNELEEIVKFLLFSTIKYVRIKVENLPSKNMEERAFYRKMRFSQYFQNLQEIELDLNNVSVKMINFKNIDKFSDILNIDFKDFLCSLKNEFFEDVSLGIIKTKEKDRIKILAPKDNLKGLNIKGITISNFLVF